jgi:hypothetical protein
MTLGYKIDNETNEIIAAPCGCYQCNNSVQSGHYLCSTSPDNLLKEEEEGVVYRTYNGTSWKWYLNHPTVVKKQS